MQNKLTLSPRRWYTWQTIGTEGAQAAPFDATPLFAIDITPLKTGKGILELDAIKAVQPLRPVRERFQLHVCHHTPDAIIARCTSRAGASTLAAITTIDLNWIRQHCARLLDRYPPTGFCGFWGSNPEPQDYLCSILGGTPEDIDDGLTQNEWRGALRAMTGRIGVMNFRHRFEGIDAWFLLRGFKPVDMDQKWLIYAQQTWEGGGTIHFHRSWTGIPVWEVEYEEDGTSIVTTTARVNLDANVRQFGTRHQEATELYARLNVLLLGRYEHEMALVYHEHDAAAAYADWFGENLAPPAGEGDRAEEATQGEADPDELPLAAFPLQDAHGRWMFLWQLSKRGEEAIFEAVAHVWASLEKPKAIRCSMMGQAAGVGGTGKQALRKVLARFIGEFNAVELTDLPDQKDYDSFEAWNVAANASFEADFAGVDAVTKKYAAILNGPEQATCSTTVRGQLIEGPWKKAASRRDVLITRDQARERRAQGLRLRTGYREVSGEEPPETVG